MSDAFAPQRFELLLPWQLRKILAEAPIAYVPLGTLEWHGEHLPVGLDALTSHGLCLRVAKKTGGVVLPALHYGTGGGHGDYPWTIMMPEATEIEAQLSFTLEKLRGFGFKKVMLFSGHFPPEQLDMIDRLAARHSSKDFTVLASAVNRIPGLAFAPDHAGIFETTLLAALWPELVQLSRLSKTPLPVGDSDFGDGRHDPTHPIYGVFGSDPRNFHAAQSAPLLEAAVTFLAQLMVTPKDA